MLNLLGFKTYKFLSPLKGFEFFKNNSEKICMVFSDFTMPEMSGTQLIKRIKEIKPNILSVLCSGLGDTFNEEKFKSQGIDMILSKPLKLKEISKVTQLFKNS